MFRRVSLQREFLVVCSSVVLLLAGCGHVPVTEDPESTNTGHGSVLGVVEPGKNEVVIVINDNAAFVGTHTGIFAGARLSDPAGSYLTKRSQDADWEGTSLTDYVRFQLQDGPWIKLYRFSLPPETFGAVESRVINAGITMPLFCAAAVQNLIAGIGPFDNIPRVWWTSPTALARDLDPLTLGSFALGICAWPNGAPCDPDGGTAATQAARR